jgi:hypothetical protein
MRTELICTKMILTANEGSWKAESVSFPLVVALDTAGVELPSQITGSSEPIPGPPDHPMEESLGPAPERLLKKSTGESKPGLSYPTVVPLWTIWTEFSSLSGSPGVVG